MTGSRKTIRLFALLAGLILALRLSPGLGAGQEAGPAAPGESSILYLPLVRKLASTIYGRVTDGGIAAAGVALDLRFYNGSNWLTIMTTTTNSGGNYLFQNMPALAASQAYYIRYLNNLDETRLGIWETRQLTSFSTGNVIDLGSFDIADIELTSPGYGFETNLPRSFQWVRRPATPSDSYKFNLFDIYDYAPKFSTPPLGYAGSYTLASLPSGFNDCNPYYWSVTVHSPDGGWGGSFWAHEVTFYDAPSYSGIYGCVTEGGVPKSSISVNLRRWNSLTHTDQSEGTTSTNASGIFSFTGMPATGANEYYYVRYANSTIPSRVSTYETNLLGSYQAGSAEHIGDFDIANITLVAPDDGGTVTLPYAFQWMPRPATTTDDYEFDLSAPDGADPYFFAESLGYTGQYTLTALPWGFSTGVFYEWNVWVSDPFGGLGVSKESYSVMFSPAGMSVAPAEPQGNAALLHIEHLRQKRLESGGLRQSRLPMRHHPDLERLCGQQ